MTATTHKDQKNEKPKNPSSENLHYFWLSSIVENKSENGDKKGDMDLQIKK